jgi:hypothetical protein
MHHRTRGPVHHIAASVLMCPCVSCVQSLFFRSKRRCGARNNRSEKMRISVSCKARRSGECHLQKETHRLRPQICKAIGFDVSVFRSVLPSGNRARLRKQIFT